LLFGIKGVELGIILRTTPPKGPVCAQTAN
jgi:hypothetical protein